MLVTACRYMTMHMTHLYRLQLLPFRFVYKPVQRPTYAIPPTVAGCTEHLRTNATAEAR